MLPEEVAWLGERLPAGSGEGAVVLNIGSSTQHYRTVMQPDIDRRIFGPLASLGYKVVHVDRKADEGVDLVGDLEDPAFVSQLRTLSADLVFCNNLLMHLRPEALSGVIGAIRAIVPTGSLLLVSGSAIYPHTSDPYDNGLRVDDGKLARLFTGFDVVESATVTSERSLWSDLASDKLPARKLALRALLPVYKPRNWLELMRYLPKIKMPYAAACAILRKA
jgi:hypothetical protein